MRLKELRKQFKLSQAELGEALGLSRSAICLYETGKRAPDKETLIKIAAFFGVSLDYLLGLDNETKENEKQADGLNEILGKLIDALKQQGLSPFQLKENERAALALLAVLSEENQKLLLELMKTFAQLPPEKRKIVLAMIRAALE